MRLNAIEIFGFKSFPHRTRLEFNAGVAAVVGPNGCGKSNIADAFRWALGEQSAKSLRGDVMGDLIFNGTADTPPLSVAEVTLDFADCRGELAVDADELTVSRRMYRNGESHFFINNQPVRLRDVRDLFADTGLGKASYAVIEQGMVEAIVRARPEERREIFEEAAGIRGYRAKRAEAIRKLEDVQLNMERLEDLYAEYQRQARALKRQANAARRYQGLVNRVRELDVGLALVKYRELEDRKRDSIRRRDEYAAAHREARRRAAEAAAEVSRLGAEIAAAELTLEQKEKELLSRQAELKEGEAAKLVAEERRRALAEEVSRLAAERAKLEAERAEAAAEEDRLAAQTEELRREVAALEAVVGRYNDALAALQDEEAAAVRELETARADQFRRLDDRTNLANLCATASATRESFTRELARLRAEAGRAAARLEEARASRAKLSADREAVEGQLASYRARLEAFAAADGELAVRLTAADEAAADAAARRENISSRLATLEELARRFESFEAGVATLMAGGPPAGVAGLIAENIQVKEGYEAAVERALGHAAGAVLVDDLGTAAGHAKRLAQLGAGRAAFVVPGAGAGADADLPVLAGVRGWAADFVETRGSFGGAVAALLRDVLVVEDVTVLEEVAALYPGVAAVTLAGDWWDGRAVLLAGSSDDAGATILGRRAEIEKLGVAARNVSEEVGRKKAEGASLRAEREGLARERAEAAAREQRLAESMADLQAVLRGAEKDGTDLAASRDLLAKEITALEFKLAGAFREEEELGARLTAVNQACEERGASVAAAEATLLSARDREEELRAELARAREEAARLRETQKGVALAGERVASVRANGAAEEERLAASCARRDEESRALDARIVALESASEEMRAAFAAVEGEVKDLRFGLNDAGARRREAEAARAVAETAAEEVGEALKQQELDIAGLVGELNALDESYAAKYDVRLSILAPDEYVLDVENAAARGEKDDLQKRLSKMGDVNFLAAREYDELAANIAVLDEQRADLNQARADLDETISRIDAQSREVFVATFERIQFEFQKTFREAFGGDGQADLKLQSGVDPLEAGIYVYAQPPGKKMEHLSLLSGGEKALTAIALIFALFNVRPAPFAILDEVDAPLDENSIARFLQLVGHYRRRVQFLVITHARFTMEAADVIYGVTMERKGISKVLSLKFEEIPEEYMEAAAAAAEA